MIGSARARVAKSERKNVTAVAQRIKRGRKAVQKSKCRFLRARKKYEEEGECYERSKNC